jgi:hypothetical protein
VVVDLNSTDGTGTSGGYAAGDTLVNIQDLTGSDFNDTFVASAAANNFEGGGGTNTVSYARANDGAGVTVDLFQHVGSNGFAAGDTYSNIQNVIGSSYADLFIADNNVNSFTVAAVPIRSATSIRLRRSRSTWPAEPAPAASPRATATAVSPTSSVLPSTTPSWPAAWPMSSTAAAVRTIA